MKKYDYIIIGGGMAGSAAVMGIRKNDHEGSIALFTDEPYPPYNRPPLSKGLWDKLQIPNIMRPMEKYEVDLYLNNKISFLIKEDKNIIDSYNEKYGYAKLLLATGGTPNRIPDIPNDILSYRTLDNYKRLRELAETKESFCVVGGGFVGSEIAAALRNQGKSVTLVFPEIGIGNRIFPEDLSLFLNNTYEMNGVEVLPLQLVVGIQDQNGRFAVEMRDISSREGSLLMCDSVVLGMGINPNVQLALEAGLMVDNGIVVNEFLQTSDPDIYAAGDVANFYHVGLHKRLRAEHEDNANQMGMIAGLNMAGERNPYTHFPFFYSDLFDLGYEAVGECSKSHRILEDWIEPYKKGVIYYLDGKLVKGILFWNLWGKLDQGREMISSETIYADADLIGLIR